MKDFTIDATVGITQRFVVSAESLDCAFDTVSSVVDTKFTDVYNSIIDIGGHPSTLLQESKGGNTVVVEDSIDSVEYLNVDNIPTKYNPVEKAYDILHKVFSNKNAGWDEASIAIEEAIGFLGEALADQRWLV